MTMGLSLEQEKREVIWRHEHRGCHPDLYRRELDRIRKKDFGLYKRLFPTERARKLVCAFVNNMDASNLTSADVFIRLTFLKRAMRYFLDEYERSIY